MVSVIPLYLHAPVLRAFLFVQNIIPHIPLAQRIIEFSIKHFNFLQHAYVGLGGGKELIWDRNHTLPHTPERHYTVLHGICYGASGAIGIAAAITASQLLTTVALSIFTAANFAALRYNVIIFISSTDRHKRLSAAIGISSNLAYILSAFFAICGLPLAITIVFGFLGAAFGGTKIMMEVLHTMSKRKI